MTEPTRRKPRQYRQGDILLVETCIEIPDRPKGVVKGGVVAQGELTGHAHRIVNGLVVMHLADMYVLARDNTRIVHEEHAEIALAPGTYQVVRQREYDPVVGSREVGD